jgi:hypothetical protein
MDEKTYDAILWILDYLKRQKVPADVTECMKIVEGHLAEVEKEHA